MRTFTVIDTPQRSEEWKRSRLGRLTGSVAGDMLATIKSGEAAARRDLRMRLLCERLTNLPAEDGFVNDAMQWGIDHEDEARIAYEMATGNDVQESGFLAHTELLAGCSLDGHMGDYAGICELKAPKTATHLSVIRDGIPARTMPQLMHNLWISGAAYCDYVSYDPRLPERLRLSIHRVAATDLDLGGYAAKAVAFLEECDRELRALVDMPNPGIVLHTRE
jgi:hypothetical protein